MNHDQYEFPEDYNVEIIDLDTHQKVSQAQAVPKRPGSSIVWILAIILCVIILALITGLGPFNLHTAGKQSGNTTLSGSGVTSSDSYTATWQTRHDVYAVEDALTPFPTGHRGASGWYISPTRHRNP